MYPFTSCTISLSTMTHNPFLVSIVNTSSANYNMLDTSSNIVGEVSEEVKDTICLLIRVAQAKEDKPCQDETQNHDLQPL